MSHVGREPEVASVRRPDGTTIVYDVAGAGPAVVFLHGLTGNRRRWTPVTDLLVDSFSCIRIDARGHGESSKAGEYGLLAMAADVGAVVSALDLDAPAVVGNSLGASVAAIFALTQRASAIVLVDQSLRPGDSAARIRSLEERLRGDGFADAMVEFEEGLGIDPLDGAARTELLTAVRSADRDVVLGAWAQLFASSDDELNAAMAAALAHLKARCLCLHGSRPDAEYASWLTRHVPHAQIEIWDGMGHFLHLADPPRFARRVREFVSG